MAFIGFLMFVGSAFIALLFNVEYDDENSVTIRNISIAIATAGLIMFIVGVIKLNRMPLYEYRINAHYIDGYTRTLIFESKNDPKIEAYKGTYWLEYAGYNELGVVRVEIINKIEEYDLDVVLEGREAVYYNRDTSTDAILTDFIKNNYHKL